jgi:hypothetical protein
MSSDDMFFSSCCDPLHMADAFCPSAKPGVSCEVDLATHTHSQVQCTMSSSTRAGVTNVSATIGHQRSNTHVYRFYSPHRRQPAFGPTRGGTYLCVIGDGFWVGLPVENILLRFTAHVNRTVHATVVNETHVCALTPSITTPPLATGVARTGG